MRALLTVLVALIITAGAVVAMAQEPPTQQPGPTPAPGGAPAPTPNVPGPGRDQQPGMGRERQPGMDQGQQQRGQFEQRPIFLSGKVILDDGTPPPEPATIERVCGGYVRPEGYTDSKGRFSFQLGAQSNVLMDASVSSGAGRDPLNPSGGIGGFPGSAGGGGIGGGGGGSLGMVDLMGCELRAQLAGFRSENIILTRRSMFDNPDVGTIILKRLANVVGTAISFTTLAAPKEAKKSFEKAQKILQQKAPKHAEAAKELEKAVQLYPQYAAAWNQLGEAKLALKDEEGAKKAFEQSLASDAKYVNPYMKLAMIEMRASRWAEAADLTKQLVQLNPYMGQVHYFNAVANFNLSKMELAEKSARNAMKSEEAARLPQAHHLLGAILARQGNFPSAADELRTFLKMSPTSSNAEQVRKQLTEWEGLGVIPREAQPKN